MDVKKIVLYNCNHVVLVPVYYDHETRPAWRKYFIGTLEECKNIFDTIPDHLKASAEENATNRNYKILEYQFLMDHGKKAEAEKIKDQYQF